MEINLRTLEPLDVNPSQPFIRRQCIYRRWAIALSLVTTLCASLSTNLSTRAEEQKYWNLSPYHIQLTLAVDTTHRPQTALAESLQSDLQDRISATLHPLWSVEFSTPQAALRRQLLADLPNTDKDLFGNATNRFDKLMVLTVTASVTGYTLQCRELDCHTLRWGPVLTSTVRQASLLSNRCFQLLRETFAPIALLHTVPNDAKHVLLNLKGSALPNRTDEPLFAAPDDIYQPLLVRTSRTGEFLPATVREVSWTYLTLTEHSGKLWSSAVHSGIKRPFGRRRGHVQQLALAVRRPQGNTRVRFYAKHNPAQSLAGYEVFERSVEDRPSQLLGLTDAQGSIFIQRGATPIRTLFLRSDGQLLAKIPVVPGVVPTLQVPIADDTARLRAQSALTALREQLVDLVARRNLLITQTRYLLKAGHHNEAQASLRALDKLPGRPQFDRLIKLAETDPRNNSKDKRIQARIDKMFADTRKLLSRYLSAGELLKLQNELHTAQQPTTAGT